MRGRALVEAVAKGLMRRFAARLIMILVNVLEVGVLLQDCSVGSRVDCRVSDKGVRRVLGERIHELWIRLIQLFAPHQQEVGAVVGGFLIDLGILGDRLLDVDQVIDLAKCLGLDVIALATPLEDLFEDLLEIGVVARLHSLDCITGDERVPADDLCDVHGVDFPQEVLVGLHEVEQLPSDVLRLDEVILHVRRLAHRLAGLDELVRVGEDVPRLTDSVGLRGLREGHAGENQHSDDREQRLTESFHCDSPLRF